MGTIKFISLSLVFVVLTSIGALYSGMIDVSATNKHSFIVNWVLTTAMHRAVERNAKHISIPDLDNTDLQLAGINDFHEMCVTCHNAPGTTPSPIAQGLNPSAPDLAKSAKHLSAAELFWVTKYGIKMTGMPAWGITHADDELWPVVAFVKLLPGMDSEEYQSLRIQAKNLGHHALDSDQALDSLRTSENKDHNTSVPHTPEKSSKEQNHEHGSSHVH